MGRRLTASEETEVLAGVVRAAHEALKDLKAAIREATQLAPRLVAEFEATHHREMSLLSNHMTAEGNRAAGELNDAVDRARDEILRQLAAQELVLDRDNGVIKLLFSKGRFDDQVPPPFPHDPTRETT